ncbi:putative FBD-associated F-box protein At5g38570 [Spinacia oleracea]|uniref:FBD-associated F-box protein At5g38570 n=1 Tax=Spinacia oleracea TaxID=3562 RepID=A0A9R0K9Y4_SPIOL|nr:putative FBD-associated F-box protein At5g38570 [Spinacia oleracea]
MISYGDKEENLDGLFKRMKIYDNRNGRLSLKRMKSEDGSVDRLRYKRTKIYHNRIKDDEPVDRLSSLPDDILLEILNLLPVCSAAATECLSKRWRGIWTQIIDLDFNDCFQRNDQGFYNKVGEVLQRFTSPFIRSFNLPLYWPYPCSKFAFDLPHLKKLTVDLHHHDFTTLENLISCCPSLEELSFDVKLMTTEGYGNGNGKCKYMIIGPKLKRLNMLIQAYCGIEVVRIFAPNLKYLCVDTRRPFRVQFETNPVKIDEARISTEWQFPINGIYNVRHLTLDIAGLIDQPLRLRTLPNLTHLNLKISPSTNLNLLNEMMGFLEKCIVLKDLTLDLKFNDDVLFSGININYLVRSLWPKVEYPIYGCILNNSVERIKIEILNFENGLYMYLVNMVEFLLSSCHVFELVIVKSTCPGISECGDFERLFCKELYEIASKLTTTSVIQYHGRFEQVFVRGSGSRVITGPDDCILGFQQMKL